MGKRQTDNDNAIVPLNAGPQVVSPISGTLLDAPKRIKDGPLPPKPQQFSHQSLV